MTDSPSSTDVLSTVTEYDGAVFFTVIDGLVAIPVPDVEPVLTVRVNCSSPSSFRSYAIVLVAVAMPVVEPVLTTLNDPVSELSEKSAASTSPAVLKYNVVPAPTLTVVIVKFTDPPSLTVVVEGVTLPYSGAPRFWIKTVLEVATTLPPLVELPVRILTMNASVPSV